jgi:hypothetical protein
LYSDDVQEKIKFFSLRVALTKQKKYKERQSSRASSEPAYGA